MDRGDRQRLLYAADLQNPFRRLVVWKSSNETVVPFSPHANQVHNSLCSKDDLHIAPSVAGTHTIANPPSFSTNVPLPPPQYIPLSQDASWAATLKDNETLLRIVAREICFPPPPRQPFNFVDDEVLSKAAEYLRPYLCTVGGWPWFKGSGVHGTYMDFVRAALLERQGNHKCTALWYEESGRIHSFGSIEPSRSSPSAASSSTPSRSPSPSASNEMNSKIETIDELLRQDDTSDDEPAASKKLTRSLHLPPRKLHITSTGIPIHSPELFFKLEALVAEEAAECDEPDVHIADIDSSDSDDGLKPRTYDWSGFDLDDGAEASAVKADEDVAEDVAAVGREAQGLVQGLQVAKWVHREPATPSPMKRGPRRGNRYNRDDEQPTPTGSANDLDTWLLSAFNLNIIGPIVEQATLIVSSKDKALDLKDERNLRAFLQRLRRELPTTAPQEIAILEQYPTLVPAIASCAEYGRPYAKLAEAALRAVQKLQSEAEAEWDGTAEMENLQQ